MLAKLVKLVIKGPVVLDAECASSRVDAANRSRTGNNEEKSCERVKSVGTKVARQNSCLVRVL